MNDRLQRLRLPSDEEVIRLAADQWRAELAAGMSPAEWEETRLRVLAMLGKETGDLGGILLGISAEQARELMAIQARLFDARGVDPVVALATWSTDLFNSYPDSDDLIDAEFERAARRLDWPEEVAISAFEMERAWGEEVEALRRRSGIEQAERDRAQEALRVQARDALRTVLGDDAFEVYRRNNGQWLKDPEP